MMGCSLELGFSEVVIGTMRQCFILLVVAFMSLGALNFTYAADLKMQGDLAIAVASC